MLRIGLRFGFDEVGFIEFERDRFITQGFAEFDFNGVQQRASGPVAFVGGEFEKFARLPIGNYKWSGAKWIAFCVVFENEIAWQR